MIMMFLNTKVDIVEASQCYPKNALNIYAEKLPATVLNSKLLNSIINEKLYIEAIDNMPKTVALFKNYSKTK